MTERERLGWYDLVSYSFKLKWSNDVITNDFRFCNFRSQPNRITIAITMDSTTNVGVLNIHSSTLTSLEDSIGNNDDEKVLVINFNNLRS